MLGVTKAVTIYSEDIGDECHFHCKFYFGLISAPDRLHGWPFSEFLKLHTVVYLISAGLPESDDQFTALI